MKDIFWEEYPDNDLPADHMNGPCMLHGRFDCIDCCPELDAENMEFDDYDDGF